MGDTSIGSPIWTKAQLNFRNNLQNNLNQRKNKEATKLCQRNQSRKRRQTKEWKEYQKEYMKKYLADPINKKCHRIRIRLRDFIKSAGSNPCSRTFLSQVDREEFVKELNAKAKAKGYESCIQKGTCIDHVISIRYFLLFGIQNPVVICDLRNLDIIIKERNSEKRNQITDEAIAIGYALEKNYGLDGFTEYLMQEKFKLEVIKEEERKAEIAAIEMELGKMKKLGIRKERTT